MRFDYLARQRAHLRQVLFEKDGSLQRAIGVELFHKGAFRQLVGVGRDVIISCGRFLFNVSFHGVDLHPQLQGTLQTPQILELSGLGNREILSQHGITTLVDLPGVGENLRG